VTQAHVRISLEIDSGIRARVYVHTRLMDGTGATSGIGSLGAFDPQHAPELLVGTNLIDYEFPLENLANGTYFLSLDLERPDVSGWTESRTAYQSK